MIPSGIAISVIVLQPLNALAPKDFTDAGIVMLLSWLQLENIPSGIAFKEVGRLAVFSALQAEKALEPISSTVFGRAMPVIVLQL